jgi:type I restriction enzyme, S subunit
MNSESILKIDGFCRNGSLVIQNGFACGEWNDEGKGVLQLRPFNVSNTGAIDLKATKFAETTRDLTPYLLRHRDVIFNNTNSEELVGKAALWTKSENA